MQLVLGNGDFTVSATINALIFKHTANKQEIGTLIDSKEYSDKIIDSYTLYF